jgi:tRNA C32,U32 (ribose-2'-O)-methylase TrmJ
VIELSNCADACFDNTCGALCYSDYIAELPVRGITHSLNVAMTASIVLYEVLARWKHNRHGGDGVAEAYHRQIHSPASFSTSRRTSASAKNSPGVTTLTPL